MNSPKSVLIYGSVIQHLLSKFVFVIFMYLVQVKITILPVLCHFHIVNAYLDPKVLGKISLEFLFSYTTVQSCPLIHHAHVEVNLVAEHKVEPEMVYAPAVVTQPGKSILVWL